MRDEKALRHWRKINEIDTNSIKRTIRIIRHLESDSIPLFDHIKTERDSLDFWISARRFSRMMIKEMEAAA